MCLHRKFPAREALVLIILVIIGVIAWLRLYHEQMVSLSLLFDMALFWVREALIPLGLYVLILRIYSKFNRPFENVVA